MLTPEQIEARRHGIGGSDAAAVLGVSPFAGPAEIYLQKLGLADVEETEAMLCGNLLEPAIREMYEQMTGRKVIAPAHTVKHRQHPWMLANIDGHIEGEPRGLEIKNVGEWSAKRLDEGAGGPLREHVIQCVHYMAVWDLPLWDIIYLCGGNKRRIFTIERDLALEAMLIEAERAFWHDHVLEQVPPSIDTAKDVRAYLEALFPRNVANLIEAEEQHLPRVERLRRARRRRVRAERYELMAQAGVMEVIGAAEGIRFGAEKITWKANKNGTRVFKPSFVEE